MATSLSCAVEEVNQWLILCAKWAGMVAPGSLGNSDVLAAGRIIQSQLDNLRDQMPSRQADIVLVLDFTALEYAYGDAIATLWLRPMSRGLRCFVIATGKTKAALEALIKISLPVPLVEEASDAVALLRECHHQSE